ncbi:antibiotic biosynthesis monooxygenase family protein [Herbiconiux sp. 11R-BC]|uniref:putative quinol monooxygenase n=1 Tax=Herbiconiux sp. 11R-BC TaxID=3111637 RepID=UPI003C0FB2BC
MTVISLLDLHLKADALEGAPALIASVLSATRAFEGNLGVDVIVDVEDPAHYVAVEKWESIEADDAYRAWRATPEGASALGEILAAAPTLTRSTVIDA